MIQKNVYSHRSLQSSATRGPEFIATTNGSPLGFVAKRPEILATIV
jgi:hypothetical protein